MKAALVILALAVASTFASSGSSALDDTQISLARAGQDQRQYGREYQNGTPRFPSGPASVYSAPFVGSG